jgi:hypothetical protein
MQMLPSYAPINKKISALGSEETDIVPHVADVPLVVKYLPPLPVCVGKASTVAHEAAIPLVTSH